MELTPYNEYLADLMEILPIVSPIIGEDLEGNEFNCREDDNPYSELLNEYHVIQYNNVFDRRKRVDDIFYLNENWQATLRQFEKISNTILGGNQNAGQTAVYF